MWNGTATEFKDASTRESELNDRQRRILDLIERGHTNREIADLLGISIDGAKWNVSEILGKLGLDSREDAAEYWRWRKRRMPISGLVRALIGTPLVKWAAGSAATAVVGGAVVWSLFGGDSARSEESTEPESFYLEATAHRADPEHPTDSEFKWWHKDPQHAKWSYDLVGPAIRTRHQTSVQEGTTLYTYSPDGETISVETGWSNGLRFPRPKDVILIGPVEQGSIRELLDFLSSWGDGQTPARVSGNEDVSGWNTVVIDYVSGRIWLDPSEMLIVKHESDSVTMTLTGWSKRAFGTSVARLPAAVAARPTPTAVSPNQSTLLFSTPRLTPTYQPWLATAPGVAGYSCIGTHDCVSEQILMSDEQFMSNQHSPGTPARGGVHILLQQRTGLATMPEPIKRGTPTPIRGVTGYLTETPGLVVLDWQEPDGRLVHMEGVDVSLDEVFKVAESLELRP